METFLDKPVGAFYSMIQGDKTMSLRHMKLRQVLSTLAAILVLTGNLSVTAAASEPEAGMETTEQSIHESLSFHAYIDLDPQGYVVYGEVTGLPDDTCGIQNLYSLDGTNYEVYHREWNMPGPIELSVTSGSAIRTKQICLQSNDAPLRDYLSGELDRFYIKLRIAGESGAVCETEAVLIERSSEPQPIPDGLSLNVGFSSSMRVFGPSGSYGKYQLTVPDTFTAEEIAAALPDTIPVCVQVRNGLCDIACPVDWKPLALSGLTAGESVTVEDAVWPVAVPAGTLLDTPLGVYRTDEPLPITESRWATGKVRLVLNVVSAGESPSGALAIDRGTLKMAFDKKPTGATAIRAYTLREGETAWTEIQGVSLLEAVDAQPATAGSGYAAILTGEEEPLRSYLAAETAGDTPVPFFVGIKIEGGVYDGKQLVLPWPSSYEPPLQLPAVGSGASGNEGNAGSDNQGDSTDEGQRPNLPQQPDDITNPSEGISDGNGDTPISDSSQQAGEVSSQKPEGSQEAGEVSGEVAGDPQQQGEVSGQDTDDPQQIADASRTGQRPNLPRQFGGSAAKKQPALPVLGIAVFGIFAAVICALIFGRAAMARFFGRAIKSIQTILHL